MKLRQLEYFVTVVETGNITRAAEQLNLAQTALGIQVRSLEETLGVPLLERHSRGVKPTRAGQLLYERALEIMRRVDETRHDIASLAGERVLVRFGATPSILKLIGSDLIVAARSALTDIELHVVEALSFVLLDDLNRGELDYILGYDVTEGQGLRRRPLMEEDLLLISAPGDGIEGDEVTFRQAIEGDLVLVSERDVVWQAVYKTAAHLSLNVNTTYQVQSTQGIKTLIQHGVARSIMPYGIVAEQIRSGELVARRIVQPSLRMTLFLSCSAHKRHFADERPFIAFVNSMAQRLLAEIGPYASPIDHSAAG